MLSRLQGHDAARAAGRNALDGGRLMAGRSFSASSAPSRPPPPLLRGEERSGDPTGARGGGPRGALGWLRSSEAAALRGVSGAGEVRRHIGVRRHLGLTANGGDREHSAANESDELDLSRDQLDFAISRLVASPNQQV